MKKMTAKTKLLNLIEEAEEKKSTIISLVDLGLKSLPPHFSRLTNLRNLHIWGNEFKTLPSEICELTSLQSLHLSENKLTSLPAEISQLTSLQVLDISRNNIKYLPPEIGKLTNLRYLYINFNQLTLLPPEIGQLTNLQEFGLANNQLNYLPKEIQNLAQLKMLALHGNSLRIPPEILDKKPSVILATYFGIRRPLNEAKFLFVGQGSVGKTSLVQRILKNDFDYKETKTEGISINQWVVDSRPQVAKVESMSTIKSQSAIKLNIWDFGGQEIMHATHQFFLTKRSLYLLVLDARLTQEENRVEYWLKIIQSFGGESPVLIVGNKTDQHPLDIDRTGLQKKYPNIVGILETSASTGAGIEALRAEITKQVETLPHVRDLLPETWFLVKSKLEELAKNKNFFTQDEYLSLCDTNDVSDETSKHTLIGFLHDLGVVLHFQDDRRLADLGILNPQWVTNGVYKILNDKSLFKNKGVLTLSLLDRILNTSEYPQNKRLFIVEMMRKFELCYDIDRDNFLIPDLLPKDEPEDIKFNGVAAFQYQYLVLPSSIITRFIVRMNKNIHENISWRTGVLLKIGKNRALVKADIEDRKISIFIEGLEHTRRDVLSAIRYQLDEIHESIKGLNPQKRIPIPEAPNAEPLEYDYLLQLERDGFDEHPVKDGNRLVKVNVRKLLSGIESESERKQSAATITNIYVGGDVTGGNIVAGDGNQARAESDAKKKAKKKKS